MRELNYEEKIVTFLDILGFKSHLRNDENLRPLVEAFIQIKKELSDLNNLNNLSSKILSDSIIISSDSSSKQEVLDHLKYVSTLQIKMMSSDIFLRGATTIGGHYEDGDVLISPALSEAYEYESQHSVYPRVLITDNLLNKLTTFAKGTGMLVSQNEFKDFFRTDFDGFTMLNFLNVFVKNFHGDQIEKGKVSGEFFDFFHSIDSYTRKGVESENKKIASKFAWLTNYFCDVNKYSLNSCVMGLSYKHPSDLKQSVSGKRSSNYSTTKFEK